MRKCLLAGVSALMVSSCGGDSPTAPSPQPAPINRAPIYTGSAGLTVFENETGVATLRASDADGDTVRFSIVGGRDADLFEIKDGAVLALRAPLNKEDPQYQGGTFFEVGLSFTDGTATDTTDVRIELLNDPEGVGAIHHVEHSQSGSPMDVTHVTGTDQFLQLDIGGALLRYDISEGSTTQEAMLGSVLPEITFFRNIHYLGGDQPRLLVVDSLDGALGSQMFSLRRSGGQWVRDQRIMRQEYREPSSGNRGTLGACPMADVCLALAAGEDYDPSATADYDGRVTGFTFDPTRALGSQFVPRTLARGINYPGAIMTDGEALLIAEAGDGVVEINRLESSAANIVDFGWPFKSGTVRRMAGGGTLTDPEFAVSWSVDTLGFPDHGIVYSGEIDSLDDKLLLVNYGGISTIPMALLRNGQVDSSGIENRNVDFAVRGAYPEDWFRVGSRYFFRNGYYGMSELVLDDSRASARRR